MKAKLGEDAFQLFASLPAKDRSYAEVAKRLGVCRGTVARTARREGWVTRLEAIQKKARERVDQEIEAQFAEINARHLKVARFLIGKGIDSLQGVKIAKPRDAAEIVEIGLKLEREVSGVDEAQAFQIEIE